MPIKFFALPLDSNSKQTGDITVNALAAAKAPAAFQLSKVTSGTTNQLNLITSKDGSPTDHIYSATVNNDIGQVNLNDAQLKVIYADAIGGNWDYVKAEWTFGSVDVGGPSDMTEIQNGKTFDCNGWPPSE